MAGELTDDGEDFDLAGSWVTKFKKFFDLSNSEARKISSIYFWRLRHGSSRGLRNFGIFVVANVVVKKQLSPFTKAV
ncbi:MAG: hypothetical protein IJP53_06765 [Synergistaceae bacterium]|nr:hypothetical protein [Synergistaceae bacterium]MBR0093742.1 hypothetical protein [Synergistaceae bacterium]